MSASEKLKALGDGLPRERITEHIMAEGWNPEWATPQKLQEVSRELRLDAYDAALPQIVAVVEAAEHYRFAVEPLTTEGPLGRALDVLDKALTKSVQSPEDPKA